MDNNQYFSVEYNCNINVHLLAPHQPVPNLEEFAQELPEPFRISSEVSHLDAASLRSLRNLGDASDELASYLRLQARKIDVILGYVLSLQDAQQERHQTSKLSASGLTYLSPVALEVGRNVRLKLFLTSESLAIYCYGEISECQQEDELYHVSVRYNRLREEDQEQLIRACLHIQTQQLKARKNPS